MKDLIEFQRIRILALMNELEKLRKENQSLSEYVLELCDNECPNDYKRVLKKEILTNG